MSTHYVPRNLNEPWTVQEFLWYNSLKVTENDRHYTNPKNKGNEELGVVTFNMDRLKSLRENLKTTSTGRSGCSYYEIPLSVNVVMLEGFRHELRVSAKWVPEDESGINYQDRVMGADINVAAAFEVTHAKTV